MTMNKEEHAEIMYQLSISIAERMYENHLLNKG
ncbi:SHOCT domain-containing protein [Streptococcus pyogenes]